MYKRTLFLLVGLVLSLLLDACNECNNKLAGDGDVGNGSSNQRGKGNDNTKGDRDVDLFLWKGINTKNIFQANAWINETDKWLEKLGIDKSKQETVVVNAANSHIASPGGGIDGALGKWAKANGTTPWTSPASTLPNGTKAPSMLPAGKFALFPVSFGEIYLAVGPMASEVKTLKDTEDLMANFCYDMLYQALQTGRKCVVLCAISTAIFANAGIESETGKKFTKEEFLKSVYGGLKRGIVKFQNKDQHNALKIILNNWGNSDEIGKKVVAQLQSLK